MKSTFRIYNILVVIPKIKNILLPQNTKKDDWEWGIEYIDGTRKDFIICTKADAYLVSSKLEKAIENYYCLHTIKKEKGTTKKVKTYERKT